MLFSVIIPTLNEELYIPDLLADFVRQKVKNFEVIVVDAQSEDKTQEVVRSFAKQIPLQVIISPKKHVAFQRNLAAKKAKGKYLLFLDADARVYSSFTSRVEWAILRKKSRLLVPTTIPDNDSAGNKLGFKIVNSLVEASRLIGRPFSTASYIFIDRMLFYELG